MHTVGITTTKPLFVYTRVRVIRGEGLFLLESRDSGFSKALATGNRDVIRTMKGM